MLHHIGIIIDDMDKYVEIFTKLGGIVKSDSIAKEFAARCVFIDFYNTFIELIQSTEPNTHLTKFIKKYGVGLHHLALLSQNDGSFKDGAIEGMKVKFNKPGKDCRILIEEVDFK